MIGIMIGMIGGTGMIGTVTGTGTGTGIGIGIKQGQGRGWVSSAQLVLELIKKGGMLHFHVLTPREEHCDNTGNSRARGPLDLISDW